MKKYNFAPIFLILFTFVLNLTHAYVSKEDSAKSVFSTDFKAGELQAPTPGDLKLDVALSIARWHGLSRDQAIVLLAIEAHEAGGKGKEFGIESIQCEFKDGRRSYLVNCSRACETIKKWCPDRKLATLKKFNHGYKKYPGWAEDRDWYLKVYRKAEKYKDILY